MWLFFFILLTGWYGVSPADKGVERKIFFSYFSIKSYVVGIQKNRLTETVLFAHPKRMFKLMDKKIIAIYAEFFFASLALFGYVRNG